MGILAGALAGGASAGLEAIKTQENNELIEKREARLREWQSQMQDRQDARQDKTLAAQAEREDKRWSAQAERDDKKEATTQKRHEERLAFDEKRLSQQALADERRYNAMMARIGSVGGSGDKAEDREVNRQIQIAKEYREQGNTAMANKVMEQLFTRTSGKAPPVLPPKPKADAASAPAAARVVPDGPPNEDAYSRSLRLKYGNKTLKEYEADKAAEKAAAAAGQSAWDDEVSRLYGGASPGGVFP